MGILRDIFGPSKEEIWQQVANEIDGKFENGGFFGKDVLRFKSGQWEMTLDTFRKNHGEHSSTYTRMRVPFINKDNLRFKIYPEGFFTKVAKFFGTQDVVVGDRFFDEKFVIKGNNEAKIRWLLQDDKLKKLIAYQRDVHFQLKDDDGWFGESFPQGVGELYFECDGVMKSIEDIKKLFELFTYTLERVVGIDSAYETNPKINFKGN